MTRASRRAVRRLWYQVHKYLGLAALTFLIVASVTGIALVYDKALDAALNPQLFAAPPGQPGQPGRPGQSGQPGQSAMEPTALAARLEAMNPRVRVVALPLQSPAGRSALLTVTARETAGAPPLEYDQVFVDPHDASIIGTRHNVPGLGKEHWVQDIYTLHSTLFAGRWGGRLMGVIGLIWLIEMLVGLYLTLPRQRPFFAKWRSAWRIAWHNSWPRLMLDLHRATGLWAFPVMLLLAYSSFAIGLYDEALVPIVNAISPPRPSLFDSPPAPRDEEPRDEHEPTLGFVHAIQLATERARADGLAWPAAVATYVPERALYGVMFTRSGVEEYSGMGPITYYLDDRTGATQLRDDVYTDSVGAKVLRSTYPIHSGQVGGNATRWLVILMGLLVFESAVTGLLVWLRRRR